LPSWDTLSAKQKQLFARQMEAFAGFAAYTDFEVGRLIDALKEMGELDNTLVFYIVGDNGSSAEGGMSGSFNEIVGLNGMQEKLR
jgi:arylsulfatase